MKQPYLGKKVLELRTVKGLTQSELVEKCNITVRTLQRIESGEVSPRAYTVKSIFEALDYDPYHPANANKLRQFKSSFLSTTEPFFSFIKDLFHLKTNTMKKLKVLSVPVLIVSVLFVAISFNGSAQRRVHKKLIGTWQVCNPDSTIAKDVYGLSDMSRYKTITKESFMVFDFTNQSEQIHSSFWGNYTLEKGVYTEFIQYRNWNFSNVSKTKNTFRITIKDDLMFVKGINNNLNEIWKKVNN